VRLRLQVFRHEMNVAAGHCRCGVSEQSLQGQHVHSVSQGVGCKRVSEQVWPNVSCDCGFLGKVSDKVIQGIYPESFAKRKKHIRKI